MPHKRSSEAYQKRKKNRGLKRGTYKHRPTVRIPDPSIEGREGYRSGFPSRYRLELLKGRKTERQDDKGDYYEPERD